ncbi:MAG TPA: hypothetical protein VKR61_13215 [Bryobacteraceae bacterium]|nr:hypothetical protein [Bryobacteraceae bacterium]
MTYHVTIYRFQDTEGNALVHLSNPALYIVNNNSIVKFSDLDGSLSWSIVFKGDITPFIDKSKKPAGTAANPINSNAPLTIDPNASGDYNYSITIAADEQYGVAQEDPQVIIGGKGSFQWMVLGAAAGLTIATLILLPFRRGD